jgi:hypothetical protein
MTQRIIIPVLLALLATPALAGQAEEKACLATATTSHARDNCMIKHTRFDEVARSVATVSLLGCDGLAELLRNGELTTEPTLSKSKYAVEVECKQTRALVRERWGLAEGEDELHFVDPHFFSGKKP